MEGYTACRHMDEINGHRMLLDEIGAFFSFWGLILDRELAAVSLWLSGSWQVCLRLRKPNQSSQTKVFQVKKYHQNPNISISIWAFAGISSLPVLKLIKYSQYIGIYFLITNSKSVRIHTRIQHCNPMATWRQQDGGARINSWNLALGNPPFPIIFHII